MGAPGLRRLSLDQIGVIAKAEKRRSKITETPEQKWLAETQEQLVSN